MELTRREFVAAGVTSTLLAGVSWASEMERLPLAFSTLGCPAWDWKKVLDYAQGNGFAAVELRGIMGKMDLPSLPEFAATQIPETKKEVADHGLKISDLGCSAEMHHAEPAERAKQLGDARKFIDLASALNVPYVRVFGNQIHGPKEQVIALVASGLHELGEHAGPRGVTVILESHGDFVDSPTLKEVITRANSKNVALLWDAHHTFVDGHEQPEETVSILGPWIRHTHLKDSVPDGKGGRKYVMPGSGEVPMERQVLALRKIGYKGYYCFEWEKVWHPEILDPEAVFPAYVKLVGGYLREPLQNS